MKLCSRCQIEKETSDFFKSAAKKDGFRSECKQCSEMDRKNYYINNIDMIKEKRRSPEIKQHKLILHRKWKQKNLKNVMITAAKRRAKNKGLEFNLTKEDFEIPQFCPVLGIELKQSENKFSSFSPSLERIDNNKGYVKDNVLVVSYRANSLKNNASLEEIEKIYYWLKNLTESKLHNEN